MPTIVYGDLTLHKLKVSLEHSAPEAVLACVGAKRIPHAILVPPNTTKRRELVVTWGGKGHRIKVKEYASIDEGYFGIDEWTPKLD